MASRWWCPRGWDAAARSPITWARRRSALAFARANIDAWCREIDGAGLDAIIVNASGCGTTLKDYGFMLREDPAWAAKAAKVSALARDVTEVMAEIGLAPQAAIHATAGRLSLRLLDAAWPEAAPSRRARCSRRRDSRCAEIPEGHLCCGSAGTYNILQPEFAEPLRQRKIGNIRATGAAAVATGNIGCIQQLESGLGRCRSCTRSSCSTGRPAGRSRRGSRTSAYPWPRRIWGNGAIGHSRCSRDDGRGCATLERCSPYDSASPFVIRRVTSTTRSQTMRRQSFLSG